MSRKGDKLMFTSNNLERATTAALALILVVGCLAITTFEVIRGQGVNLPEWLQTASGLGLGYYFGVHRLSNSGNGGN